MKNKILIIALLVLIGSSLKAQQGVNAVISFRPTISTSAIKTQPEDVPTGSFYFVNKRKQNTFNFNVSIEIPTKKDFYHFPVLGFYYLNSLIDIDEIRNDKLIENERDILNRTNFWLGYGIGKYVYIHKQNVFLNFKNSIAFQYALGSSKDTNTRFSTTEEKVWENVSDSKLAPSFSLMYELNPAIGYRIKNISLSLGVPLNIGLNIINGKNEYSYRSEDFVYGIINSGEWAELQKSTSFSFRYNVELSFRYHFGNKKNSKKSNK